MTTLEILIGGRARIDTPDKWIKGVYARNAVGVEVEPCSLDAVCYCSRGAVEAAAWGTGMLPDYYEGAIDALAEAIPKGFRLFGIPRYQDRDETTHADVMAMFDRAIEAERAKEPAQ